MIDKELRSETEKWLIGIKKLNLKACSEKGKWIKENAQAYIKDCEYFLKINDLIRAFECIIWAWAFVEIGKELGEVEIK